MIQTLTSDTSRQTQPQRAQAPELSQLASKGILKGIIGVPRIIALEKHRQFTLVEVNVRIESLRASAVSHFMSTQTHTHVIWRIIIDKFHLKDPFASNEWQFFLELFRGKHSAVNTLVLSYDWEVEYSHALLASIDALQKSTGLAIFVDAEHYSWKTPIVQAEMQSLILQQVFHDAPYLPGLVKDASYHSGAVALLRCLGRNRKGWFESNVDERFAYSYSSDELHEIADRILALKENHERILVTFCNRPSANTVADALRLASMLQ